METLNNRANKIASLLEMLKFCDKMDNNEPLPHDVFDLEKRLCQVVYYSNDGEADDRRHNYTLDLLYNCYYLVTRFLKDSALSLLSRGQLLNELWSMPMLISSQIDQPWKILGEDRPEENELELLYWRLRYTISRSYLQSGNIHNKYKLHLDGIANRLLDYYNSQDMSSIDTATFVIDHVFTLYLYSKYYYENESGNYLVETEALFRYLSNKFNELNV